jgi:hypothetical protein
MVLKLAVLPGQLVCEISASAVVGVFTVSKAQLVTPLQLPVTSTQ